MRVILRTIALTGAIAASLALVRALPAAATDASSTSVVPVPGGAGSLTCTLFYHQSTSGDSVRPYDIGCRNDTNRYVSWKSADYYHEGGHLCGGFDTPRTINPQTSLYFSISLCAPWEPKRATPYFESHFSATGSGDVVAYNVMY
jgi:hypothetical protein